MTKYAIIRKTRMGMLVTLKSDRRRRGRVVGFYTMPKTERDEYGGGARCRFSDDWMSKEIPFTELLRVYHVKEKR